MLLQLDGNGTNPLIRITLEQSKEFRFSIFCRIKQKIIPSVSKDRHFLDKCIMYVKELDSNEINVHIFKMF